MTFNIEIFLTVFCPKQ